MDLVLAETKPCIAKYTSIIAVIDYYCQYYYLVDSLKTGRKARIRGRIACPTKPITLILLVLPLLVSSTQAQDYFYLSSSEKRELNKNAITENNCQRKT